MTQYRLAIIIDILKFVSLQFTNKEILTRRARIAFQKKSVIVRRGNLTEGNDILLRKVPGVHANILFMNSESIHDIIIDLSVVIRN